MDAFGSHFACSNNLNFETFKSHSSQRLDNNNLGLQTRIPPPCPRCVSDLLIFGLVKLLVFTPASSCSISPGDFRERLMRNVLMNSVTYANSNSEDSSKWWEASDTRQGCQRSAKNAPNDKKVQRAHERRRKLTPTHMHLAFFEPFLRSDTSISHSVLICPSLPTLVAHMFPHLHPTSPSSLWLDLLCPSLSELHPSTWECLLVMGHENVNWLFILPFMRLRDHLTISVFAP